MAEGEWYRACFTGDHSLESSRKLTDEELEWANAVIYQGITLEQIALVLRCQFRYKRPLYEVVIVG